MRRSGREKILERIRASLTVDGASPPEPGKGEEGGSSGGTGAPPYRRAGHRREEERLDLFVQRVSDYRAGVVRSTPAGLGASIAGELAAAEVGRLAVPADLPEEWLQGVARDRIEVMVDGEGPGRDQALSAEEVAGCHGVLTGCAMAIAETGTIILDAGRTQGRRILSLLPDYHLCVVFHDQVVETVPEAVEAMASGARSHRRPFTLISGPSATSDIELIRVEGVHGPRNLRVILVEKS
jgi:L-lactate dehydrogenase complex protein LldG